MKVEIKQQEARKKEAKKVRVQKGFKKLNALNLTDQYVKQEHAFYVQILPEKCLHRWAKGCSKIGWPLLYWSSKTKQMLVREQIDNAFE